jgi:hypothetical protein
MPFYITIVNNIALLSTYVILCGINIFNLEVRKVKDNPTKLRP